MHRLLALLAAFHLAGCSGPAPPPARPRQPNPTIRTLDRLIGTPAARRSTGDIEGDLERCLARAAARHSCVLPSDVRTLSVRVALDDRYPERWPDWEQRLSRTAACVNTLYRATGLQFDLDEVVHWTTGRQRHDLYGLLRRLQREVPFDGKSLVVGITVWDKRRVYSSAGGEIGLSQYAACVVPSWPRVENDCVILAHELGHLVGARHVPGKQWIMGWAARPFHLPAADPVARVTALYRFHPRNRTVIALHRRARFAREGLRLPPSCHERLRAIDRCWRLDSTAAAAAP